MASGVRDDPERARHSSLPVEETILPRLQFSIPPGPRCGALSRLPVELLYMIINQLDIRSVFRLAATCQQFLFMIYSWSTFRDVATHAMSAIVALHKTRLLHHVTVADLHSVLQSSTCSGCGHPGPYLFLVTCERICFFCLRYNPCFYLLRVYWAKGLFGIPSGAFRTARMMHTDSSARYTMPFPNPSYQLVAGKHVREMALQHWGSQAALDQRLDDLSCTNYPGYPRIGRLARWIAAAPCRPEDGRPDEVDTSPPRLLSIGMGVVVFPSLSPDGKCNFLTCMDSTIRVRSLSKLDRRRRKLNYSRTGRYRSCPPALR
jgi:hypothetical protein